MSSATTMWIKGKAGDEYDCTAITAVQKLHYIFKNIVEVEEQGIEDEHVDSLVIGVT